MTTSEAIAYAIGGAAAGYALASIASIKSALARIEAQVTAGPPRLRTPSFKEWLRATHPEMEERVRAALDGLDTAAEEMGETKKPRAPYWQPLPPDEDPEGKYERDATTGATRRRGGGNGA